MFEEGQIIYFDPFYFKNGNTAKPKYFVVLKINDGDSILASLPTRRDNIPAANEIDMGCVELPDIILNCFVLRANTPITECNKTFTFQTHIYGHQLDEYSIQSMLEIYPIEDSDYSIWGKLKQNIYDELIQCLANSKSVKRKYKKLLR